jgi:hypothetical protein
MLGEMLKSTLDEIDAMSAWNRDRLGTTIPLHFMAFHPAGC